MAHDIIIKAYDPTTDPTPGVEINFASGTVTFHNQRVYKSFLSFPKMETFTCPLTDVLDTHYVAPDGFGPGSFTVVTRGGRRSSQNQRVVGVIQPACQQSNRGHGQGRHAE